jgi:hypothetical protein
MVLEHSSPASEMTVGIGSPSGDIVVWRSLVNDMARRPRYSKIDTRQIYCCAIGLDKDNHEQNISITRTAQGGFDMHPSRGVSTAGLGRSVRPLDIKCAVATQFGLTRIRLEDPRLLAMLRRLR